MATADISDPALAEMEAAANAEIARLKSLSKKTGRPRKPGTDANEPLAQPRHTTNTENIDYVLDRDWAKFAFMLNDLGLGTDPDAIIDQKSRVNSTANRKFTDTTLGGNIGINSRPQFTWYSDIRVPGAIPGRNKVSVTSVSGNFGMGRYYSEAIDDTSQTIYLRFGVAQFTPLMNFFSGAFDPDMSSIARTGQSSIIRSTARMVGGIAMLMAMPGLSLFVGSAKILAGFFRTPNSKFYSMRPAMHMYWGTVNSLVNAIAVNKGIFKKYAMLGDSSDDPNSSLSYIHGKDTGKAYVTRQEDMQILTKLMPGVFEPNTYGYNMYACATKAQRYANLSFMIMYEEQKRIDAAGGRVHGLWENITGLNPSNSLSENLNKIFMIDATKAAEVATVTGMLLAGVFINPMGTAAAAGAAIGIGAATSAYNNTVNSDAEGALTMEITDPNDTSMPVENRAKIKVPASKNDKGEMIPATINNLPGNKFFDHLNADHRQGSDFAVFKVDSTGSVSESFGNSETTSDLDQKLNGSSSSKRETRFSFADGSLSDNFLAKAVGGVLKGVYDVAAGAADAATFGVFGAIEGMLGNGYIDIPKHWQSSSASLPEANYKIQLISPYGNPYSQMQNIYIPLSMLMAGTLPLSTGKQSYTSPMLVQVFDRGRCQIQLGMIKSLSIQRGTSNLNFNSRGVALGVDVSLSITDLSSIMHMPVGTGSLLGPDPYSDPDNILMDYLAVLAGMDIYSQIYAFSKARLNLAKKLANLDTTFSSAFAASYVNDSLTSGWMKYILPVSIPYNIAGALNSGYSTVSGR